MVSPEKKWASLWMGLSPGGSKRRQGLKGGRPLSVTNFGNFTAKNGPENAIFCISSRSRGADF